MMVDWSLLPYDPTVLIASRLNGIRDFLAFSAVCRSWRSVYENKDWNPGLRFPWLMLNEKRSSGLPMRRFLSICDNKVYNLLLPQAHGRRCWGSSHEWLVATGSDLKIQLLNPITRVCIDLPPQFTFDGYVHSHLGWFSFISKAFVIKIQGDHLLTMLIFGHQNGLAFTRPSDNTWTLVQTTNSLRFINLACFKDQIFALTLVGTLFLVEINGTEPPRAFYIAPPPNNERGWQQIYLVESLGNLLMVFRYTATLSHNTVRFKVYKFDIGSRVWMIMEDLGDCVLFLDDSYCTSFSAYGKFKCNSIYFADDNLGFLLANGHKRKGHYMGVYHMKERATSTFCLGDDSPFYYTCPIWMMPTLYTSS